MMVWKIVVAAKNGNAERVRECLEEFGEEIDAIDLV
jgi:hypothetical protein